MRLIQLTGMRGEVVINPEHVEAIGQEREGLVWVCFVSKTAIVVEGELADIADRIGRVTMGREL